jgi:hypothetical protein
VISRVTLTRSVFAIARRSTAALARATRGTAFRFVLSERSTVTIRIYRVHRRRPHFIRTVTLMRRLLGAGLRSIPFSGRVGTRALLPGRYRATLRARDPAGNLSAGRAVSFTILRG